MRGTWLAGALVALLGVAVMAGWQSGPAAPARVPPWGPPIFFTAGLAFLGTGVAVTALALGRRRTARWAAAAAGAVGLLSLAEYAAGARDPGHVSLNTAICVLLGAGGVWLLGGRGGRGTLGAALSGSLVAALGAGALLGRAGGRYEGIGLHVMAVPAALAATLLGLAVLILVHAQERRRRVAGPPWLFAPVGLAVLVIAVGLWQALLAEQRDWGEQELAADAALLRGTLADGVGRRVAALVRCGRRAESSPVFTEDDWEVDARLLYQDFSGFQAVVWAGPDGVVRRVVPQSAGAALRGRAVQGEALQSALRERIARMSGPLELPLGGRGFAVYAPVYREGRVAGLVVGLFRIRELLDSILEGPGRPGNPLEIYAGGAPIYAARALPRGARQQQTVISWAGASWLLRVAEAAPAPREGALAEVVMAAGILLAGALSVAVHLAQSARRQRDLAEEARGELSVRVGQRKVLSELGQEALAGGPMDDLMRALVAAVRDGLAAPLVEILELAPGSATVRLRAGVGWREGLVGRASESAGLESRAGYTLLSRVPVIVADLRKETRFSGAPLLHEHGVISGVSVAIPGRDRPFGVLGAHCPTRRSFTPDDVNFMQAAAALLASALERQRAEWELDRFFELSLDMLCVADMQGHFRRVNAAFERILGHSRAELLARPYLEWVHPDDREATQREMARLAQGRATLLFGNRYQCRNGSYRWLLWNCTPLADRGVIFAAARDITELKAAEEGLRRAHAELERRVEERTAELAQSNGELEAEIGRRRQVEEDLREREERFRRLFEEAPIGIALLGPDGRFQGANAAFCGMAGYDEAELAGLRECDLTHAEDRERSAPAAGAAIEKRYVRRDGSAVWANVTNAVLRRPGSGAVTYLTMAEDITGRIQRDQEIRTLNQELARRVEELTAANRELEEFTYTVSHDLRAPLRHVDGFSRLLLEEAGAGLDEGARHYLGQIRHGARRMGVMVDELLNLSRVARGEPVRQLTNVRRLVDEVLADLKPEVEGREVEVRIGDLRAMEADPGLLRHVLVHLVSNALKFTRPRARAVIEVGRLATAQPEVIYVRDNGVGFSMKYADKLFGVFQRLHRAEDFEGTGIGLATVRRIVEKHGGRVWAEAEVDRGATFYFTLEAGTAAPEPARQEPVAV